MADGRGVINLGTAPEDPSWALGMPGFTTWVGLTQIGAPKAGETIGVAGRPEKCAHSVDTLGFDMCLDHKSSDFVAKLKAAAPKGSDVYCENAAGVVLDAVCP